MQKSLLLGAGIKRPAGNHVHTMDSVMALPLWQARTSSRHSAHASTCQQGQRERDTTCLLRRSAGTVCQRQRREQATDADLAGLCNRALVLDVSWNKLLFLDRAAH